MFESDCTACHRSPRGLASGMTSPALVDFLRAHYTTGVGPARALADYLLSVPGGDHRRIKPAVTGEEPAARAGDKPLRQRTEDSTAPGETQSGPQGPETRKRRHAAPRDESDQGAQTPPADAAQRHHAPAAVRADDHVAPTGVIGRRGARTGAHVPADADSEPGGAIGHGLRPNAVGSSPVTVPQSGSTTEAAPTAKPRPEPAERSSESFRQGIAGSRDLQPQSPTVPQEGASDRPADAPLARSEHEAPSARKEFTPVPMDESPTGTIEQVPGLNQPGHHGPSDPSRAESSAAVAPGSADQPAFSAPSP